MKGGVEMTTSNNSACNLYSDCILAMIAKKQHLWCLNLVAKINLSYTKIHDVNAAISKANCKVATKTNLDSRPTPIPPLWRRKRTWATNTAEVFHMRFQRRFNWSHPNMYTIALSYCSTIMYQEIIYMYIKLQSLQARRTTSTAQQTKLSFYLSRQTICQASSIQVSPSSWDEWISRRSRQSMT